MADDVREVRWRAMGSEAHVVVVGGSPGLLDMARGRVEALEARWSRFRPDSELCRLNAASGPAIVSADLFEAVRLAVDAWQGTDGRYDPTVLDALVGSGYDRTFEDIPSASDAPPPHPGASPGCAGIVIDPIVRAVRLPEGVRLDLGGIGKGLAADFVTKDLLGAGARGACVNLGGDVRVQGEAPTGSGWVVQIAETGTEPAPLLAMSAGAVATSTRLRRRWTRAGEEIHHIVDPRTGRPARGGLQSVTAVTGSAWRAEILAKAAFVAGRDDAAGVLADAGATGLLLDDEGVLHAVAGIDRYLVR